MCRPESVVGGLVLGGVRHRFRQGSRPLGGGSFGLGLRRCRCWRGRPRFHSAISIISIACTVSIIILVCFLTRFMVLGRHFMSPWLGGRDRVSSSHPCPPVVLVCPVRDVRWSYPLVRNSKVRDGLHARSSLNQAVPLSPLLREMSREVLRTDTRWSATALCGR